MTSTVTAAPSMRSMMRASRFGPTDGESTCESAGYPAATWARGVLVRIAASSWADAQQGGVVRPQEGFARCLRELEPARAADEPYACGCSC
jgi:hypothetical protein